MRFLLVLQLSSRTFYDCLKNNSECYYNCILKYKLLLLKKIKLRAQKSLKYFKNYQCFFNLLFHF